MRAGGAGSKKRACHTHLRLEPVGCGGDAVIPPLPRPKRPRGCGFGRGPGFRTCDASILVRVLAGIPCLAGESRRLSAYAAELDAARAQVAVWTASCADAVEAGRQALMSVRPLLLAVEGGPCIVPGQPGRAAYVRAVEVLRRRLAPAGAGLPGAQGRQRKVLTQCMQNIVDSADGCPDGRTTLAVLKVLESTPPPFLRRLFPPHLSVLEPMLHVGLRIEEWSAARRRLDAALQNVAQARWRVEDAESVCHSRMESALWYVRDTVMGFLPDACADDSMLAAWLDDRARIPCPVLRQRWEQVLCTTFPGLGRNPH